MRSGHRRRWCCTNALRRDVVRPGKDQRDWKAHKQHYDHQTQRPVWQFPCRKRGGGQLYNPAGSDDVGCCHAVHLAPFRFLEEAGYGYSFVGRDHKATPTTLTREAALAFT